MVGHSWGGAIVRYFVGNHSTGVVGVLYLDPTDITLTTADLISMFDSIGAGKKGTKPLTECRIKRWLPHLLHSERKL
jgi:hypothetical protein